METLRPKDEDAEFIWNTCGRVPSRGHARRGGRRVGWPQSRDYNYCPSECSTHRMQWKWTLPSAAFLLSFSLSMRKPSANTRPVITCWSCQYPQEQGPPRRPESEVWGNGQDELPKGFKRHLGSGGLQGVGVGSWIRGSVAHKNSLTGLWVSGMWDAAFIISKGQKGF